MFSASPISLNPTQVAVQLQVERALGVRRHGDPLNLAADDLRGLGLDRRVGQRLLERRHLLALQPPGRLGCSRILGGSGADARRSSSTAFSASSSAMRSFIEGWYMPVLDRPDHARGLALDDFQLTLVLGPASCLLGGQAVDLLLECAGELFDQLGRQQPILEPRKRAVLELVPPDPVAVVAGALGMVAQP
jgi:hypothetical protein